MKRGEKFVPTRLTERVGMAIAQIGKEFTVLEIRQQCPDLPYRRIWHLLDYKMDMGVVERIGTARFQLIRKRFAERSPTGVISDTIWRVLREHRRHPLPLVEIARQCGTSPKIISVILSIWRRRGALIRSGVHNKRRYRLARGVQERPLTTIRDMGRTA